mgnify:CR=1 FL=1
MERLREHLGVERWLVFGGSWGSALALAYAQTHPERVLGLVLRGVFTLRKRELDWYYEAGGADMVWPDEWERFVAAAGTNVEPGGFIERYHELLTDPDPAVHGPAGIAWTTWEAATSTLCATRRTSTKSRTPPTPSPSPASRTTSSSTAAGWRTADSSMARTC